MTNLMTAAIEISGEAINENNEVVVITGNTTYLMCVTWLVIWLV